AGAAGATATRRHPDLVAAQGLRSPARRHRHGRADPHGGRLLLDRRRGLRDAGPDPARAQGPRRRQAPRLGPRLLERRVNRRDAVTLLMLYVTQYVGVGFITIGLVAILRDGGTPLETLGALTLIGLVWPLKVLWAPLLDRYGSRTRGHYRSWLLVLQSALVVALPPLLPF